MTIGEEVVMDDGRSRMNTDGGTIRVMVDHDRWVMNDGR
jgi:hypothetical protein